MNDTRFLQRAPLAMAFTLVLAGCGSTTQQAYEEEIVMPDEPGLYALYGEELQRLDGSREWENQTWNVRSALPAGTEFVIYDPSLAREQRSLEQAVQLRRVGWLRSEISAEGEVVPIVDGSRWTVAQGEGFEVPVNYSHVAGRVDVIHAEPVSPLEKGLYSLQVRTDTTQKNARLGIQWPRIDHDQYATKHCVDRYVGADGSKTVRACRDQEPVMVSEGLKVHLVQPRKEFSNGVDMLIVEGVVANTTEHKRSVPSLMAELKGADGQVLKRWHFDLPVRELAAGESASFKTEASSPPEGTKTVQVKFAETVASSN